LGLLKEDEDYCMDYEYWLRIGRKYRPGMINDYLANFRFHPGSKSGHIDKKQFQDELRLAIKYGKKYPVSLMIHRMNYLKIIILYKIMSFFHV